MIINFQSLDIIFQVYNLQREVLMDFFTDYRYVINKLTYFDGLCKNILQGKVKLRVW